MATINKISINCSGTVVEYNIGLADTNDAGINAILSAIPIGYGTYSYSHNTSGGNTTAVLTYDEGSCDATLYSDGIGVNTANVSNCVINPDDLLSSDAGNATSLGGDGKLYTSYTGGFIPAQERAIGFSGTTHVLSDTPNMDFQFIIFTSLSSLPVSSGVYTVVGDTVTFSPALALQDLYFVYYR